MPRWPSRSPRIVTLTTDVGAAYAAQMKGVLLRSLPPGHVVDLVHDLPVHGIEEAAFLLRAIGETFPAGTVHVVVIDPGVGGSRAPLIVRTRDGSSLVGPDNGVLWPLAQCLGAPRAWRIDPSRAAAPGRIGRTFDGRDLFAPAAARLALGVPAGRLGVRTSMLRLELPIPRRRPHSLEGRIVHVDRFGNLITNLPSDDLPSESARLRLRLGSRELGAVPWAASYEALGAGRAGVLASSFGTLEVSVARGNAARRFRARAGVPVRLHWTAPARRRPVVQP